MRLPSRYAMKAKRLEGQNLCDYLCCLHEGGWSIRSIAAALEKSPTTITKYISKGVSDEQCIESIETPPELLPVKAVHYPDVERLRTIVAESKKSRSPYRTPISKKASEDLTKYIRVLYDEGHPMDQIAVACGLARVTVNVRLNKTIPGQYFREDLP